MVEKHVDAKRYLVAAEPSYKERLSEASLKLWNIREDQ
jgi:predicted HD phosphohydrolase